VEIERLSAFLAVADELNFRKAATRLHIATSPLSRYIRDLEVEVGARLFDRDTRHVRLTSAGAALLPHAVEIIAGMEDAKRAIRRASATDLRVVLTLGMRVVSPAFQARIEGALTAVAGRVALNIVPLESSLQLTALQRGYLDIGVGLYSPHGEQLESLPLLSESLVIALPNEPRYRDMKVVHPADISGLKIILLGANARPTGTSRAAGEVATEFHDHSDGVVNGAGIIPGGIRALISAGHHCALLPAGRDTPWRDVVGGAGVIIRPLPPDFPLILTSACWRQSRDRLDDLSPYIDALRREFPVAPRHSNSRLRH
jgi:DNA-binding transcriptional LysR family regulator